MKFLAGFITAIAVIIVIGLIIIYSGLYDVSAAKKESGFTEWILETTMDNSIEKNAKDIHIPSDLNDIEKIKEGSHHYKEMCEICHGGPGLEESELAKGLNPKVPDLEHSAKEMKTEELFWITKNGIKMTAMPAWGLTHSDDKIWAMIAFIKKLPGMSPEKYKSYSNDSLIVTQGEHYLKENH